MSKVGPRGRVFLPDSRFTSPSCSSSPPRSRDEGCTRSLESADRLTNQCVLPTLPHYGNQSLSAQLQELLAAGSPPRRDSRKWVPRERLALFMTLTQVTTYKIHDFVSVLRDRKKRSYCPDCECGLLAATVARMRIRPSQTFLIDFTVGPSPLSASSAVMSTTDPLRSLSIARSRCPQLRLVTGCHPQESRKAGCAIPGIEGQVAELSSAPR